MPRRSNPGQPLPSPRTVVRRTVAREPRDLNGVYPATRTELMPIALASMVLAFLALLICASRGWLLLYGDAVAHLGIARRILDARYPGLGQLGGVWLPLPHLLMVPFVQRMEWWQNGIAGAWPSMAAYIFAVTGCYALARKLVPAAWSFAATAFFALNPNLMYLSTTAMTEPLFLALLLWSTVVAYEATEALHAARPSDAGRRMMLSGLLTMAMVFTRYDGWIVGAVIWLILAQAWWSSGEETRRRTQTAFIVMTLLAVAGPLLWFAYNARYQGDWLDFMRGPYSAAAIEKKTTPLGAKPRRGLNNPGWALLFYTRAAQVDAAAWELGFGLMFAALAGAWLQAKAKLGRIALLLWVPLPFYVYSVAYGHVPIFIPQLYPHSFYNSRYGMELLPALAIGAAVLLAAVEHAIRALKPKLADVFFFVTLVAILFNVLAMFGTFGVLMQRIYGETDYTKNSRVPHWLSAPPLVYEEAVVNSRTRIPFELALSKEIQRLANGGIIMFDTTDHIGAIQDAGIPLKTLISPLDSQSFDRASLQPARYANLVVALDNDPVAKAVEAHPEGLKVIEVLCHTGQPCAKLYASDMTTGGAR